MLRMSIIFGLELVISDMYVHLEITDTMINMKHEMGCIISFINLCDFITIVVDVIIEEM